MISGLYSAATGMDAASVRHEVSAENLAHAHLPGYRRRRVQQSTFNQLLNQHKGTAAGYAKTNGASVGVEGNRNLTIDFSHGPQKHTGRNLDVALDGDGFFAVEGPDGPLYTRSGSFFVSSEGQLVTIDGLRVSGANGEIQIPPNTSSEQIVVSRDGELSVDGVPFGQLQIVDIPETSDLVIAGNSLFRSTGAAPEPSDASVYSGQLEMANVHHMEELVNIMVASRQYEASQRAMRTIEQSVGRHINGN